MPSTILPSTQHRRSAPADARETSVSSFASCAEPVVQQTMNVSCMEQDRFEQSIIESSPLSMIATDLSGMIVAMNSAAERLTHYRKPELVGLHSLLLLHDPGEVNLHAAQLSHDLQESIPAGLSSLTARPQRGMPEEHEWIYVQKGGSQLRVNVQVTPLRSSEGVTVGYLAMAFDITDQKTLIDRMAHMAQHDQLTGLPNRTLLDDRIEQAIMRSKRFGCSMAIYIVNIDNFRRFNDSLGYAGGDTLLRYVADQLTNGVRQIDTVARVGGDEFAAVMQDFGDAEDAALCAERLQQNIAAPIMVDGREISVTASIGFCLYPDHAKNGIEMLRNANLAMRAAKKTGHASLVAYSHSTKVEPLGPLEMEEDLRHALGNGEFSMHYQPQVDCVSGEVTGLEALLRWTHPRRGNVSPNEFIPLAEEIGLMVPISEWIFEQSCADCVDLQKQTGRPLTLAVNLSPRQFEQRSLPALVERTLRESGLAARNLELEITEQMLMVNSTDTMETLEKVRAMGVGIAIDDFGTGFSSFSYIMQYRADRIKIDRSFIAKVLQDANATTVVRAMIAMAHGLNMTVVAEGVETLQQHRLLLRLRCDVAQGFLFSRAAPKHEFSAAVDHISSMRRPLLRFGRGGPFRPVNSHESAEPAETAETDETLIANSDPAVHRSMQSSGDQFESFAARSHGNEA